MTKKSPRWSMRVVSDWQSGIAEIGHSTNSLGGEGLIKVLASSNEKTGVAHISLADAKELRRALSRVIREIEQTMVKPVISITEHSASKKLKTAGKRH